MPPSMAVSIALVLLSLGAALPDIGVSDWSLHCSNDPALVILQKFDV